MQTFVIFLIRNLQDTHANDKNIVNPGNIVIAQGDMEVVDIVYVI